VAATTPLPPPVPAGRAPGVHTAAQRWVLGLAPWLIALVTFAAFLPALQNQFVWDDDENFVDNYHYRGLGWTQLRWMWTAFHLGHYIPLTWMTFGLDYLLWGMNPVGYHLTNLVAHAANAALFYLVAFRILALAMPGPVKPGQARLALSASIAALLFALHPLRVESVAWATERRDVLSGLFYVLTILAYLRAWDREGERGRWYWVAVALFGCALLSKSMAVNLPVVLLILDVYPLRRLGGATGWWGAPARRVYVEKIPFFLLAAAASAITFMANTVMASLDQLSVLGRLAISAYSLSFYLWKTVAPVSLSPLYELGPVDPWATPFLLSYGGVLAITALAWARRRRWPGLATAWLAYVVILLPVLGVFQNGPQIAADRYTYLAGLGWAILTGAGLRCSRRPLSFVSIGLVVVLFVGFGTLTWNQVHVWQDTEKLWAHALAIDPKSPTAHLNVGAVLADQGKLAEAIEHYRQALHFKPDYAFAHYNLGTALARRGQPAEAAEHYRRALAIKPDYAGALNNWGNTLTQMGKLAEAVELYRRALTIKPDYADAHYNLGVALAQQGKPAEAIELFQRALKIRPDYADAHRNWGSVLAQQGKPAEADEHFRRALRIRPAGPSNTTSRP
jgi:Tfp pilus assembly protein PilF